VDLATARLNLMGHHTGYGGEVDDSFLGYTKSGEADGVRLKFANLFVAEQLQAFEAIRSAALQQGMQARHFVLLCRQHDLPAQFMGYIVLHAKVDHPANALNSQASLCRTRLVVQPTVQNTAVVSGLMAARTAFLLQKKQPSGRKSLK
jgi:enoyl reductase-like protein